MVQYRDTDIGICILIYIYIYAFENGSLFEGRSANKSLSQQCYSQTTNETLFSCYITKPFLISYAFFNVYVYMFVSKTQSH